MRKLSAVAALCCIWIIAPANTQQVDVAFGGGSLSSAGSSFNLGNFVPSEAGGTFVGFSGNVLIKGDLGAEGEVFWRASQNCTLDRFPIDRCFGTSTRFTPYGSTDSRAQKFWLESERKAFASVPATTTATFMGTAPIT